MNYPSFLLYLVVSLTLILPEYSYSQLSSISLDDTIGFRLRKNHTDQIVYSDLGNSPNKDDFRKINYRFYFRIVNSPTQMIEGVEYQLITIPGTSKKSNQEIFKSSESLVPRYLRSGEMISKKDFDKNFWIETEVIDNFGRPEYDVYANDFFSGLLTAPFKYRLKLGSAKSSLLDGDLNIAPFIGWKWRASSEKPYYIAPFGFSGITTLNYSSVNNTLITSNEVENVAGLTYGFGLSFKFGAVSPGIIIGWDKGLGDLSRGFKYNDKAWLSFSMNYDFFKPKESETKSTKKN